VVGEKKQKTGWSSGSSRKIRKRISHVSDHLSVTAGAILIEMLTVTPQAFTRDIDKGISESGILKLNNPEEEILLEQCDRLRTRILTCGERIAEPAILANWNLAEPFLLAVATSIHSNLVFLVDPMANASAFRQMRECGLVLLHTSVADDSNNLVKDGYGYENGGDGVLDDTPTDVTGKRVAASNGDKLTATATTRTVGEFGHRH